MINQTVSSIKNPYDDFSGYKRNPQFIMTTPQQIPHQEDKKNHVAAYSIGISALVVGFAILGFTRGSTKNLTKHLEKLKGFLESKVEKSRHSKSMEGITKAYTFVLNKVNSLILKSESVNNFVSIKDSGLKYFMDKTKFTKKIHEGITKLFTKASRSTVRASWANTTHKFNKVFESLQEIDTKIFAGKENKIIEINGIKKTGKEWMETLQGHRTGIMKILGDNSSAEVLAKREADIYTATDKLDRLTLKAVKHFKNPRLYKSFIADDFILKAKEDMFLNMTKFRQKISLNTADKQKLALHFLQKTENMFLDGNKNVLKHISILKAAIKNNAPEKEIQEALANITKSMTEGNVKQKIAGKAQKHLDNILPTLQNKNSGEMQEMLEIYKKLAPDEYDNIAKQLGTTIKRLDNSIEVESLQYFDKIRDFQIGSAPTDVLSIVGSGGYIAYALSGNKDLDEKISVTLKEGIPVLSTVATSLFCAAKLVSGSKAMAVGLVSGWIMNRVGEYVDAARKKYFPITPQPTAETTPKTV